MYLYFLKHTRGCRASLVTQQLSTLESSSHQCNHKKQCLIKNADVHPLDHIQGRQYLQEAKLHPKVKVVLYESEADNSGKNHSTSTRNPTQTQETVYELSISRRNEASFEAKAKRSTTKYKTKRKKQRKSNSWLRRHRKIV